MKDAKGHGSNARGAMPLKGHDYHTKSDSELRFITKDASEAAKNMQGMGNGQAEGKYLDQANDAQTVLGYRARGGSRVSSDADAAKSLASGPKSAPVPVHDSMSVGDRVHLGFGAKGGAGFFGKLTRNEGGSAEIKHDNGKTYSGPSRFLSR